MASGAASAILSGLTAAARQGRLYRRADAAPLTNKLQTPRAL
jgi:hypothetical protein